MPSRKPREPRLRDFLPTRNARMRGVLETIGKVLDHDVSILVAGDSGTGKDYLAEAIHACGTRRDEPFIHIDCASIPAELFESELFGHERGTFTDAHARKIGKLELARGGTVYFDQIGALTPPLQAKLLRAIEERRFTRLGSNASVTLSARVISSTSADPRALVAAGSLRGDLFYRINVVTVALPPLRERREDITPLATRFLKRATRRFRGFAPEAIQLLESHLWPGNVRELRNAVERAALLETTDRITIGSLPIAATTDLVGAAANGSWTLEQLESAYIRAILRVTGDNYSRAAEILGINRKTLLEKRKRYGIE